VVTVTIEGGNDAAVITGTDTGTVSENSETTTATGDLNASDVDNATDSFQAVVSPTASVNGYGTFTLTASGVWTYTLDNGNAAVDALNVGQTLTDSFTVYSADGTSHVVTVTIEGSNDAPTASPVDLPDMVEDGYGPTITLEDVLGGVSDPDGPSLSLVNVTIQSGEGTVEYNGEGGWTYTPPENYSGEVVFNYTVSDGSLESSSTASLHIEAVADAPTLTATIVSSSFENGDLGGWLSMGDVYAGTQFNYSTGPVVTPTEGNYMAVLGTDGASQQDIETFLGLPSGALDAHGNGNATVGSTMVFELQVTAGDVVTFDWNFITNDYMPYNDYAVLTINGQFIELSDVQALGNLNGNVTQTGWTTYTYNVTQTGTLTIGFAVVDVGDQIVDSALLVDNVQVNYGSSIPLDINASFPDGDGSETHTITIAGLPDDASLSAGTDLGGGVWSLTPQQLIGLSLNPPYYFSEPITLTITATATENSNESTASTSTTLVIDPPYSNFASQSFSSDMSLMAADTTEAPEQSAFVAAGVSNKSSTEEAERRGLGDIATMQAVAAAAGIAAFTPQWAQAAAQHHETDDPNVSPADKADTHGWQKISLASLAEKHAPDAKPFDFQRDEAPADAGSGPGSGKHPDGLSDMIAQHFAASPEEGREWDRFESRSEDKTPDKTSASDETHASSDRHHADSDAPRIQKSEAADGHEAKDWKNADPGADGHGPNFGKIVDFSSLPTFDHKQEVLDGLKHAFADLKHVDFSGIVDFARDLLPDAKPPSSSGHERGDWKGEAGVHHAPAPEPVHVAANDMIQNMANDMESAAHHHGQ